MRLLLLALTLGLGGCGGDAEEAPPAEQPEYEGLSREQIESQAESMSPEEAERLGIVDTTIQIGAPVGPDSLEAGGVVPPPDTAAR